uniref:Uncharacterized protein n=1 Tax=Bactrocera dorsalis TaxID=27457 RepID=A0A034WB27_BACDO
MLLKASLAKRSKDFFTIGQALALSTISESDRKTVAFIFLFTAKRRFRIRKDEQRKKLQECTAAISVYCYDVLKAYKLSYRKSAVSLLLWGFEYPCVGDSAASCAKKLDKRCSGGR